MTTALIIGCVVGYVGIAAITAGVLWSLHDSKLESMDELVVIFGGVLWPISIPIFLAIYMAFCVRNAINNRMRRKQEFESEALKIVPEEKECG